MKKKQICLLLALMFWLQYGSAIAATNTVLKLAYSSAAWAGTATKNVPTMVSNGAAVKWYSVGLTPASIATIVGLTVAGYLIEKGMDYASGKWFEWLGTNNFRISNGVYQSHTSGAGYVPVSGSAFETAYNFFRANEPTGCVAALYPDAATAQAAYNAWKASIDNEGEVEAGAPYQSANYPYSTVKIWGWHAYSHTPNYKRFYAPDTAYQSQVTYDDGTWTNTNASNVSTAFTNDITSGSPSTNAKAIADAVLGEIATALQNGSGTILTQAVRDALNNAVNADLSSTAKTALDTAGDVTANTDLTEQQKENAVLTGDMPWIDAAIAKIRLMLGIDTAPADVTQTGIDENENTTAVDSADLDDRVATAKAETQTILGTLYTSIFGLREKIMDLVEDSLGSGGSVCSIPFSVWGGSQALDFCDIDLSTWKTVIIAVAVISAAVILIL